jgi:hypothetical protein
MNNGQGEPRSNNSNAGDMAELIKQLTSALTENKQARIKEPNTYDGTRDALLIDGWIRSVERYAAFYQWDSGRTCLLGTTLLRGRADAWFRTIENTDDAPTTWLEFKRLLIEFFRPDNSVRIARDRLAVLKQTGDLVDYINNFMDIKLAIPKMTDEEACDKFIRGLNNEDMRAHIRQYEAETLKAAIQSALSFDSARQQFNFYGQPTQGGVSGVRGRVDDPMELDALDQRRGYSTGKRFAGGSNGSINGPKYYSNNNRQQSGNSGGKCYYCQKSGHMKRNCKLRLADIRRLDEQHAQRRQDFQ